MRRWARIKPGLIGFFVSWMTGFFEHEGLGLSNSFMKLKLWMLKSRMLRGF